MSWIAEGPRRLTLFGRAGYGFIAEADAESLPDGTEISEGGSHNRIQGTLGAALRIHRLFGFALGATGRFDFHPDDADGSDSSGFGKPWVVARVGGSLGALSLGGEVRWELFGGDAPAFDIGASRLALRLLAGYEVGDLHLVLNAGFRIDGSSGIVREEQGYRQGDLVSLAANDWNAVLVGLAANYSFGIGSTYLEATAEPFVGSGAPGFGDSPIRVGAGTRFGFGALSVNVGAELALQSRTLVDRNALREVEPLVRVFAGLAYTFDFDLEDDAVDEGLGEDEDEVEEEVLVVVDGRIEGPEGTIAGASVVLVDGEGNVVAEATTDETGAYRFELPSDTDTSTLQLRAEGEGFTPIERGAEEGDIVTMTPVSPEGALRGLVRDFRGRALDATIRVGEETVVTDEDGVFEMPLVAGEHEVTIVSDGMRTQTRTITIEEGGVTVLNVDMRRAR